MINIIKSFWISKNIVSVLSFWSIEFIMLNIKLNGARFIFIEVSVESVENTTADSCI